MPAVQCDHVETDGRDSRQFSDSPTTTSSRLATGAIAWLAAVLVMALVVVAPSRSRWEVPENLLFGILGGSLVWGILLVSTRMTECLGPVRSSRLSRSGQFALWCLSVLVHALLILLGLSLGLRQSFAGLLVIVGLGIPISLLLFVHGRVFGFSRRLAVATVAPLASLLAIMLLAAPFDPKPIVIGRDDPQPDDIVLLCWNIGQGAPFSTPSRPRHLTGIVRTIVQSKADVVCLQELAPGHLPILLQQLGDPWRGMASEYGRATCVLTRLPATFRLLSPDVHFGGLTSAVLTTRRGQIEILSCHLPPQNNAPLRRQYADWLVRYAATAGEPVVMAGDLNMDPDGWWDRVSCVFTDDPNLDRQSLAALREIATDVGRHGAATAAMSRQLDRIFVPPPVSCGQFQILVGKKQGRMDHTPVAARIRLVETAGKVHLSHKVRRMPAQP